MHLFRYCAGLFLLATLPATAQESTLKTDNPMQSPQDLKVDSLARAYFAQKNVVGGVSIGVVRHGRHYFYNYGETRLKNGQLPDSNTVYEIGSLSKTFTATLFALQVNARKMRREDPVNLYLPDSIPPLKYRDTAITMLSLTNHSSGLPRLPGNLLIMADPANPYELYTTDMLFTFLKHFKPERAVGAKYEYSNLAVGLMSTILGLHQDQTYEQLLWKQICKPLKMTSTSVELKPGMLSRFAAGYNVEGYPTQPWDFQEIAGMGGIRSTATDMVKYVEANIGAAPAKLAKAMALCREQTFTDGTMTVGMGWLIARPVGHEYYTHTGATGGFATYVAFDPVERFGVTVLCNRSQQANIGAEMMRFMYGL